MVEQTKSQSKNPKKDPKKERPKKTAFEVTYTSSVSPIDEETEIEKNIRKELEEAEEKAASYISSHDHKQNWKNSRLTVEQFKPVPWYIWRIVNHTLGRAGKIKSFDLGMVFALRKLLILTAQDPDIIERGAEITDPQEAVRVLPPDVFCACAIIHAIGRKLKTKQFERIWHPILEEALLRTRIGYSLGRHLKGFGPGRGMLAGFAGRVGLAIQIATGTLEQAKDTIDKIAEGGSIQRIGREVYRSEPLQVSAMMLIASGCGRDGAYGIMAVAGEDLISVDELTDDQKRWRTALLMLEQIRGGNLSDIPDQLWEDLGYSSIEQIRTARAEIRQVTRRGHAWSWMVE